MSPPRKASFIQSRSAVKDESNISSEEGSVGIVGGATVALATEAAAVALAVFNWAVKPERKCCTRVMNAAMAAKCWWRRSSDKTSLALLKPADLSNT
jgi:hypothetical protein